MKCFVSTKHRRRSLQSIIALFVAVLSYETVAIPFLDTLPRGSNVTYSLLPSQGSRWLPQLSYPCSRSFCRRCEMPQSQTFLNYRHWVNRSLNVNLETYPVENCRLLPYTKASVFPQVTHLIPHFQNCSAGFEIIYLCLFQHSRRLRRPQQLRRALIPVVRWVWR